MAEIIEMPKLSDTMTEGVLVKWLKQEGDKVQTGDMLAEVETDKATMELESFFDGTLIRIFAGAGDRVPIGAPLCAIGEPGEKVEAPEAPKAEAPAEPKAQPEKKKEAEKETVPSRKPGDVVTAAPWSVPPMEKTSPPPAPPKSPPAPASGSGERIRISPLARKLAAEKGLDPRRLQGSGPGGRIVRADVVSAAATGSAAGVGRSGPVQEERLEPVSTMRGVIARRLLEAKTTIPHFYLEIEIDAGPLLELRVQLNEALEADGVKLSVNDFVLKAAAGALRQVPDVNCSWEAEGIRRHGAAHVSFAVAIPDGLITPVIRDTQDKTLFAISAETKTLARRAKDKKLAPAEFTGGTFCVTNLGMMGIDRFYAIINPPNAAILAVGTTVRKPVVRGERIEIGQRMTLTLACDHRVVDGAIGATYLTALKDLLERPALLLL